MAFATLDDVFTGQIEDLYSAETQLVGALPKIAAAASDAKLRHAITTHLEETRGHVDRLQQIKRDLGMTGSQQCKRMAGVLAEGEDVLGEAGVGASKDAAIIGGAQRVEHYEIRGLRYSQHARQRARIRRRQEAPERDARRRERG